MAETKKAPSNIILGSGYIYYQDFNDETIPDVDTICTEANVLGYIQGGATLSYKPTFYTASDDDGTHQKTIIITCGVECRLIGYAENWYHGIQRQYP